MARSVQSSPVRALAPPRPPPCGMKSTPARTCASRRSSPPSAQRRGHADTPTQEQERRREKAEATAVADRPRHGARIHARELLDCAQQKKQQNQPDDQIHRWCASKEAGVGGPPRNSPFRRESHRDFTILASATKGAGQQGWRPPPGRALRGRRRRRPRPPAAALPAAPPPQRRGAVGVAGQAGDLEKVRRADGPAFLEHEGLDSLAGRVLPRGPSSSSGLSSMGLLTKTSAATLRLASPRYARARATLVGSASRRCARRCGSSGRRAPARRTRISTPGTR